ncbi:MAG: LiaI-LiaF-like domain-containing protein [Terriglobales bacterium]
MNCYQHPERTATAYCRLCGRPLCSEDQRDIYGVIYCQNCLARQAGVNPPPGPSGGAAYAAAGAGYGAAEAGPGAGAAAAAATHAGDPLEPGAPPLRPGVPNAGVALALGFIPGVGAIYNGQYFKAFLQVVIFGFLVSMSHQAFGTIFGIGAAAFYFYMVIDSYRTARALELGQPLAEVPGFGAVHFTAPTGAVVLIAIGAVLLLRSLNLFAFDVLRYFWPVLLIVIGALMLERRRQS